MDELVKQRVGGRCAAGFYQRVGDEVRTLDWRTLDYRPRKKFTTRRMDELLRLPPALRIRHARALRGRHGEFLRRLLIDSAHYCASAAPTLAGDIAAVDRAMEWGYGWSEGPFKAMDALGLTWLRTQFAAAGRSEPALFADAGRGFYRVTSRGVTIPPFPGTGAGRRLPLPVAPGRVSLSVLHRTGKIVERNAEARCIDLGDGVLCIEFCAPMNTLGHGVVEILSRTSDRIMSGKYTGLVIGNDDPDTFSAGTSLLELEAMARAGIRPWRWNRS